MKRMTISQKVEALENALLSFNFPKKFFIQNANKGANVKFALASKPVNGNLDVHTRFMTYDEINAYLVGYYDAKMKKF